MLERIKSVPSYPSYLIVSVGTTNCSFSVATKNCSVGMVSFWTGTVHEYVINMWNVSVRAKTGYM